MLSPGETRYQLSLRDRKTDAEICGLGWSTGFDVPDEKIVEAKNVLHDDARPAGSAYVSVEEVIFVDYGNGFTGTRPSRPNTPPNKVYLEAEPEYNAIISGRSTDRVDALFWINLGGVNSPEIDDDLRAKAKEACPPDVRDINLEIYTGDAFNSPSPGRLWGNDSMTDREHL